MASRLFLIQRLTGALVFNLGLLVILGWILGNPLLISVLPGWVSMKANTAFCFMLSGIALLVFVPAQEKSSSSNPIILAGILIALLAGMTGVEYLFNCTFHIDELVFRDGMQSRAGYIPGRMSPISACAFVGVGFALLFLVSRRSYLLVQGLALGVALFVLIVITGTFHGMEVLHNEGHYVAVALHTNIGFALLSVGLLCATGENGIMRLILDRGEAGTILRQLLPAAILLPLLAAWACLWGVRRGLFPVEMATSLISLITLIAFTLVVLRSAAYLYKSEEKSRTADALSREGLERYLFLINSVPQIIWTAKPDGTINYYNWRWLEYTGIPLNEAEVSGWQSVIHAEDLPQCIQLWDQAVATGQNHEVRFRLKRAADDTYRWHLGRSLPCRKPTGVITHWVGSCIDIDDELRMQEKLEKLVQERTTKLIAAVEELEAFSYSISHDLRAPLRAMIGFATLLQKDYGHSVAEGAKGYLDRICVASKRMDSLIGDLLNYSRISQTELVLIPLDPRQLLIEIVSTFPHLGSAELDLILPETLPHVLAHEAALSQCFSNLLGNAVKFVAPGRKAQVQIKVEREEGQVKLWFQDNGIGIAPSHNKRIFEIFQRLDRKTEGTGIGLSLVKKAISRMQGEVGVESTLGQGAAFWLKLKAMS